MDTRDRSKQDSPSNGNGHGKNGNGHGLTAGPARDEPAIARTSEPDRRGLVGFFDRAVERLRTLRHRAHQRERERTRTEPPRDQQIYGAYMPGGGTTGNPLWSGMRRSYASGARDRDRRQGEWYEGDPYWKPTRPTFERGRDPDRYYASDMDARRESPDERREHWQGREGLNPEIRSFPRRPDGEFESGRRFVEDFSRDRDRADAMGSRGTPYTRGRDEWTYRERDERDRYERTGFGARSEFDERGIRPQGRAWGGDERGPWEDRDRERRFGRTGLGYEGPGREDARQEAYARGSTDRPDHYDYRTQRERDQRTDGEARRDPDANRDYRGRR